MKINIYHDWFFLIEYYWSTVKKSECRYEIILPLLISLAVTMVYSNVGAALSGLLKLRDLLPATLAILIGFTIACIAMLAASESSNIKELKLNFTKGRNINGVVVSLYQWILTLFCYELLIQTILLLFTFFVAFIIRVVNCYIVMSVLLFVEVALLLHISFLLVRCVTYIYFTFFPNKK
ncbi:hypothetical protein [Megasphaera sp.]|uniref:hypothetical protein n=1 Tax=Megasphaera sp. TaxID=2023260 RepID=UPI0035206330